MSTCRLNFRGVSTPCERSAPGGKTGGAAGPVQRRMAGFMGLRRREGRKTSGLTAGWQAEACRTLGNGFFMGLGRRQVEKPLASGPAGRLKRLYGTARVGNQTVARAKVTSDSLTLAVPCGAGVEFFRGFRGPKAHSHRPGGLSHTGGKNDGFRYSDFSSWSFGGSNRGET
jgi:hypothetical protein